MLSAGIVDIHKEPTDRNQCVMKIVILDMGHVLSRRWHV